MWLVFLKELKELLRDRKTLFFMIAIPVLMFPAIFGAIGYFSGQAFQKAESKVLNYALIGGQYAPVIDSALASNDGFKRHELATDADFKQQIKNGELDFVLDIPATYGNDPLRDGQINLQVYLNDAGLNFVVKRLNEVVDTQSAANQQAAFTALGLSEEQSKALLEPIVLEKQDLSDQRENWGEKIGGFVPYLLLFSCLMGAIPVATDIGAGEKERGTLETLLLAPVPRKQLIMGKLITVAFAGGVSALVTVSSMLIWGLVLGQGMAIEAVTEVMAQIGVLDFVLMFAMLLPVVVIFAAALLSLSIYARSYKEAQSYTGMLPLAIVIPIVIALMPGVKLEDGWAWVPLTNVSLAIKELVKGTMDYFQLVAIFGSTAIIAGALFAFCVYWFNKEKVLFR